MTKVKPLNIISSIVILMSGSLCIVFGKVFYESFFGYGFLTKESLLHIFVNKTHLTSLTFIFSLLLISIGIISLSILFGLTLKIFINIEYTKLQLFLEKFALVVLLLPILSYVVLDIQINHQIYLQLFK